MDLNNLITFWPWREPSLFARVLDIKGVLAVIEKVKVNELSLSKAVVLQMFLKNMMGSSLAAENLLDIRKPNKRALRRARIRNVNDYDPKRNKLHSVESGSSDTSCVRRLHRFNAADENNGWSLVIYKELKYLTQNNVWNLITCFFDHGSTGSKSTIIKCIFDGVVLSDAGPTRSRNINWTAYRDNALVKHIHVLTLKRRQWVIKLLLTHLSMEPTCEVYNRKTQTLADWGLTHDMSFSLLDCLGLAWCLLNCQTRMRTEHMCTKHHLILEFARRCLVESTLICSDDLHENLSKLCFQKWLLGQNLILLFVSTKS
ncbi:unnamed protein product [Arabis nemorensis]|uniref:Uncharacterized protein n=1 Tax=Arabis nemorensis TaxID=586526 RepID=A0A565ASB8_9BRAS|nr:unnamed protein product [Arabis nemorensis]